MTETTRSRVVAAERARRISLFGATMMGTAIGGYLFTPFSFWGAVLLAGLAMCLYAGKLKQPGDEALTKESCEQRTTGEVVLFGVGVLVFSGALVGSVLIPSLLWVAVGLGGVAMTIRYQVRRAHSLG
ncbi:MAG: hypothetical protein AAGE03_09100 [Pseudomonadota bacterium]